MGANEFTASEDRDPWAGTPVAQDRAGPARAGLTSRVALRIDLVTVPDRLVDRSLHWDQSFPQAQAIGDTIVHGRMKWSTLGQVVSDCLGADGWVRSVSCQYRGINPQGTEWLAKGW